MMKEIKYRAYSKRTKKVYHVLAIFFYQKVVKLSKICGSGISFLEQIDDVVLMQYTGLEDKNDVEIYEGDIVKVISGHGWEDVSDVVFGLTDKRYGNYPAFCMPGVETESNSFSEVFDSGDYEVEVIGNIYQNNDLLEG